MRSTRAISPSRSYVILCHDSTNCRYAPRIITLPEDTENDVDAALDYYYRRVNIGAGGEVCMTIEEYLSASFAGGRPQEPEAPESQADSEAHFDVAWDLHCLENEHGNPHVHIRIERHIARHLARHNQQRNEDYAARFTAKYNERYQFWLNLSQTQKAKS
ncbi:MAG: hypothetical protein K2W82_17390 [Candidatus Obscuribacterales bacterium]|nr:hypothetical protein [Candidatus Obscuribacterales bacterium]